MNDNYTNKEHGAHIMQEYRLVGCNFWVGGGGGERTIHQQ